MAGMLRVPRSRGALSGLLLVLLGLWGGLIPFVGPYADFAFTPNRTWFFNGDRFWLNVVPAVAIGLGGLIVLFSANRAFAVFGAWLAALGGGWFIVGPTLSVLWKPAGASATGAPIGSEARQVAEHLAFFTGVGALALFFAALALGRFTVVGVREARYADDAAGAEPAPAGSDTSTTQPVARPGVQPGHTGPGSTSGAAPGATPGPAPGPGPTPGPTPGPAPGPTPAPPRGRYSRQPEYSPRDEEYSRPPEPTDQRVAGSPRPGPGNRDTR